MESGVQTSALTKREAFAWFLVLCSLITIIVLGYLYKFEPKIEIRENSSNFKLKDPGEKLIYVPENSRRVSDIEAIEGDWKCVFSYIPMTEELITSRSDLPQYRYMGGVRSTINESSYPPTPFYVKDLGIGVVQLKLSLKRGEKAIEAIQIVYFGKTHRSALVLGLMSSAAGTDKEEGAHLVGSVEVLEYVGPSSP